MTATPGAEGRVTLRVFHVSLIGICKNTIAVAGTGYVGLSIATLLSQHHKVKLWILSRKRWIW